MKKIHLNQDKHLKKHAFSSSVFCNIDLEKEMWAEDDDESRQEKIRRARISRFHRLRHQLA